jgi:hypothetical protein
LRVSAVGLVRTQLRRQSTALTDFWGTQPS